jgi:hypothetical protein
MRTRTYTELSRLPTFEERFDYLKLDGSVGQTTFGFGRYINQTFYTSREWKQAREGVIVRDNGCDLGVLGYEIHVDMLIHHVNPIIPDNIIDHEEWILDPEFLILTTKTTHNAIHYGTSSLLPKVTTERKPGDTKLW